MLLGGAELLLFSIPASFILLACSGFLSQLVLSLNEEIVFWKGKPFYRAAKGFGLKPSGVVKRLCIMRSYTSSVDQYLVWVIGELVIVESLFNAPGLGNYTWQLAKTRQINELLITLGILFFIYSVFFIANQFLVSWIGRRLDSYA